MDKTTYEVRRLYWSNIIEQCQNRSSGTSAKKWLNENSIKDKSYYYWLRKLRKETFEQMKNVPKLPSLQESSHIDFAEIPISPSKTSDESSSMINPTAVIKTSTAAIAISNEISDRLLSIILQEVSHA